ncbi:putative Chromo domain protein Chp1p [Aspergillus stella-maris]|uniref:putative Chromo domain protein Chp1p n=1 Tax=Aspergillus stella-maris TaxID=1810926 RepID=UPI003CCDC399
MAMGSVSDDEISLTSTVESEQQPEYDVEEILAESDQFEDGVRYLVRWLGYPVERSSWEPADSFHLGFDQTLSDWQETKQRISEGKEQPFDVDALETKIQQLHDEQAERKRRRAAKRHKLRVLASSRPTRLINSPVTQKTASRRVAKASTSRLSGPRSRSLYQDHVHPARQGLIRPPVPKPPPPVAFGSVQATSESQATKKLNNPDQPKFAKNLSTKWRYEKLGRREPAPNPSQLDLRRPSDWNSMPSVSAAKPAGLRLATDINDNCQDFDDGFSMSSSPHLSYSYHMSPIASPSLNNSPREISNFQRKDSPSTTRQNPATQDPFVGRSNFENVPRGPRSHATAKDGQRGAASEFNLLLPPRKPTRKARKVNAYRWWNYGEYYVTMYFGPEKQEIGNARLCGIGFEEGRGIYQTKVGKTIELWFRGLCSLDDYQALCEGMPNNKISNGWIEGFDDNEPDIRRAAEVLWQRDQVAIARINSHEVLLAYPPRSPVFSFLDDDPYKVEQGYLNLTLRGALRSIKRLRTAENAEANYYQPAIVSAVESGHPEPAGVNTADPLRGFNVAQESAEQFSASTSTLDHPDTAVHATSSFVDSPKTLFASDESIVHRTSPPSTDLMDVDNAPSQRPTNKDVLHQKKVLAADTMDLDKPPTQTSTPVDVGPKPDTVLDLDEHFAIKLGFTFEKLSSINTPDKPRRAELFYVWFPEDFKGERELVMMFLKKHTPALYSNSVDSDWDRFTFTVNKSMMQGAVLFHGSFVDYHKVPSLRETLYKTKANFWNISLAQPLGDANLHVQQLFPRGGVFLLTEDLMIRDPDSTMIILDWFHDVAKRKSSSSRWKIMLRPNILTWLIKQMDRGDKSSPQWLAIYQQLGRLGCTADNDPLTCLNDDHDSCVISLPILPKYGARTPDDSPDIPRECTQEHRNADHLAEYFAGWSLLNAHRFRRFVIVSQLPPVERWKSWQHIETKHGARAFFESQNIDYRRIHAKITKDPWKTRSSTDASAPYTPRTPRAPDAGPATSSAESRPAVPAAPQVPTRHIYAQPYS